MGDEDSRREFIRANLPVLIKSTVVGTEFVAFLFSKGVIDEEERELLSNSTTNIKRANLLYSTIANKWSDSQFEYFKKALHETGNQATLQVFTNAGADVFLTIEQVQLLRQQREKTKEGCYEGLSLEDEVAANKVVQNAGGMFGEDGKFVLSVGLNRKEVVPLVKHFEETLKNEVIWWNPRKLHLPSKYIERWAAWTYYFSSDGSFPTLVKPQRLVEITAASPMVLIVDTPGMGKSSEMSDLENKLRIKVTTNRVILRVNLNEVQRTLATLSPNETASSVLLKLAPFIPANILSTVGVRVFVLLDGLDEVCPKHKDTMINLLRIFTSASEPTLCEKIRVVLTTRPHLKEAVEKQFNLQSWSLLPLTQKKQDEYMKSVLGVSDEQLSEFRGKLTRSVADLLSNPLMLSMFVDVFKSEGTTFSGGDEVNIFELYTRYVESKHKLQLVEKEGMRAEDNFTERHMQLMFQRNLPHYYRVAIRELIDEVNDSEDYENEHRPQRLIFRECEGSGLVAQDEPSGVTRDELLSIGLLVEGSDNQLVFKHRSFAEFFYARLLTQEESAPQIVRDILFHCIYADRVENVKSFLVGISPASLSLSPKWLLLSTKGIDPTELISKFAGSHESFPFLVREFLLSFVQGDPDELWEAHRLLFDQKSRESFRKLFDWMSKNREWTREELLKINQVTTSTPTPNYLPVGVASGVPQATARLMFLIGLHFEGQELLCEEEVGVAVNSCDHRIIYIVAQFKTVGETGRSKWEWVEDRLFGGGSQLKMLFLQMDDVDLRTVIEDRESASKLVSTLSHEEISALVSSTETRVSDVIGEQPLEAILALGEEFVPRGKQLAEFRGKFGAAKGKTVFEIEGGWQFALDYLWDVLVGEVQREDASGPVTVALREALQRMGQRSWELLRWLEKEVRRRVVFCRRKHSGEKEEENGAEKVGVKVMDWVTRGVRLSDPLTIRSLGGLPFLLRYYGNVDSTHLSNLLQQNNYTCLFAYDDVMCVLSSLVILSSLRSHDNEDSSLFPILTAFLREQRHQIPSEWTPLFELFLGATREQIGATSPRPPNLVSDLSVGGVALNFFTAQKLPTTATNVHVNTWGIILRDVIQFMPCCDIPAALQQICRLKDEDNKLEMLLKEVLTSKHVLWEWRNRFSSQYRRENVNPCAVRNFLSFYFSVFGLNCDWMKMRDGKEKRADKWFLVKRLPVEISSALRGNPHWTHLLPQFQQMLREHLRENKVDSVGEVLKNFFYRTEGEWETLLILINGETLLPGVPYTGAFRTVVAAAFLRAVINLYGVKQTKFLFTHQFWKAIPATVKYNNVHDYEMWMTTSSVGSLGSLLHSAIELGELEEVKRRAWPGLVSWRNGEGKTALQVADKYDERHPIRLHLDYLTCKH